ncbi:MAG: GAF domain-containing protein, partial [Gemmatimonadetes bacterium]|nr:GAF domain-containing protein [Gemmatimonadota bacterium]
MTVPDHQGTDSARESPSVDEIEAHATRLADEETSRTARSGPSRRGGEKRFLSRASQVLAESTEYESTLLTVAGMALPQMGSWCIVDIAEADGSMRRLGIVHPDPLKKDHARRLKDSWPPARGDPIGLPRAVLSRASEFIPDVTDEMLVDVARSAENLRDLRALGIGSLLVVPLIARANVIGSITFVSDSIAEPYADADLELAEDLATRCALTLDNARLLRDANEARAEAEHARARAAQMNERLVVSSIRQQELAEEAREASLAKSQFLATMSHEIRTPINAVIGYADLLELEIAGPLNPKQRAYLDRILASCRHLMELIEDILDLSKVEAGRMELKREAEPVDDSIAAAVILIQPQATAAGLSLTTTRPENVHFFLGDGDRVRQILTILLSNAVKFTEPGASVSVRGGATSAPDAGANLPGDGPWVFIQVTDTG